jgi:uncharacterized membrane protein
MTRDAHPKTDDPSDTGAKPDRTVYFDATLSPHRSLSPRGFLILMSAIGGTGFLIGFGFFMVGAWPVAGFCGLEILLVYLAFRLNYRESRRREHLRLARPGGLEIERIAPNGETRAARLEPTWLRVEIDNPPEPDSQLRLIAHGRAVIVGSFLSAGERAELAEALRAAITRYRGGPVTPPGTASPPAGQLG